MNARLTREQVRAAVRAGLPHARWDLDEDADELELVFPGAEGHAGRAVLINDEFYLRLDEATNAPLSIIVPGAGAWLRQHLALWAAGTVALPPVPAAWPARQTEAVARSLGEQVARSEALRAAVA